MDVETDDLFIIDVGHVVHAAAADPSDVVDTDPCRPVLAV